MGCGGSRDRTVDVTLKDDRQLFERTHKLLLLGAGESGKSTIMKQVKVIHLNGFSSDEKRMFKQAIERNVIQNMQMLIEACELWELEVKKTKLAEFISDLDETDSDSFCLNEEVRDAIKTLWKEPSIKTAWGRANETQVLESAAYFFDSIDRLDTNDYEPKTDDILRARQKTTGIIEVKFSYEGHEFRLVDVGGQRSERRKWLHCFEDCTAVMFCVAMNEYDKMLYEEANVNRMHEAVSLFQQTVNSKWFDTVSLILFLNKSDLFRDKISTVDLKVAFPEYSGGLSYDAALLFIASKFKSLRKDQDRKTFVHVTTATNTDTVKTVLSDVFEILEKEKESAML
eukprot:TRINITY_DN3901_c0_g1_i1.p1 TRINITY_DN3901_c0_g1~~TRINITY_DN3901_c0_g1_i1.p1  ORF type:complete len:361 (+),score=87.39 TRINITY_DN3901_c0_g1_i1:59-1084(+)